LNTQEAASVLSDLGALGIDLDEVAMRLEVRYADQAQRRLSVVQARLRARQENR
jgi:hypothetical protein